MASRNLPAALKKWAELDTDKQVTILRNVNNGYDTDTADRMLGYLAGMAPEKYDALKMALGAA